MVLKMFRKEQKHKETNNSDPEDLGAEVVGDGQDVTLEETENEEYSNSFFKMLILMGKEIMPLDGHETDGIPGGLFPPGNFQASLERWINHGEEVLRQL